MAWCILINTTPKYMPLAEVQVACIRRYAPNLDEVPIFLATEVGLQDYYVHAILESKNTHYISLEKEEAGFIESRIAATAYLPEEYEFILPLQEDFWLDRAPDYSLLNEALEIIKVDEKLQSIRLMPSPGPNRTDKIYKGLWRIISDMDQYKFTFQATLWRRNQYQGFLEAVLKSASKDFKESGLPEKDWAKFCVRINVAENLKGQAIFSKVCMDSNKMHIAIERRGTQPNAVFLAPWPYRPTAVVQGKLEPWALEFASREGFNLYGWN